MDIVTEIGLRTVNSLGSLARSEERERTFPGGLLDETEMGDSKRNVWVVLVGSGASSSSDTLWRGARLWAGQNGLMLEVG